MNIRQFFIKYYFIAVLFLLILGGLGLESQLISWTAMLVLSIYIILFSASSVKLKLPGFFKVYLAIIVLMIINLLFSSDVKSSYGYLLMFIAAGEFWLVTYNHPDKKATEKNMMLVVYILAIFFGQYFIIEKVLGYQNIKSFAIFGFTSITRNHNHIGDLFSLLAPAAVYKALNSRNKLTWLLVSFISFAFIFISESRSAIVSVTAVTLILFWRKDYLTKYKRITSLLIMLMILVFLYLGQFKSLFISREYFLQGVAGLLHNPLGVGMGNFAEISQNHVNYLFGASSFSAVAHNLPLEFLDGMGVIGLVFVYFYVATFAEAVKSIDDKIFFPVIFLALSVNFFFDFTYMIPMMLWLWFLSFAHLSGKSQNNAI